jgi:hypothetical protein
VNRASQVALHILEPGGKEMVRGSCKSQHIVFTTQSTEAGGGTLENPLQAQVTVK